MVTEARRQHTRAPLRALILEDSENDVLLLLRELARDYEVEHQRVETSGGLKEALAGRSWDVIFSDYEIPGFGAPEALKLARREAPDTPFVVVSGKVGEDVAAGLLKAGAYDYVMKDNLARLKSTVERGLEEAEAHREKRRAEEKLRASEAGLANAQRIARLGNWEWDLVSYKAYWSDELYRIHGLDPRGPPLTWEEFLRCVHPADRERVGRSLHEALHEGKPYDVEHRIFRTDGSERIVHCQLEVTFDGGRANRAVGTVHDVTERKKDEEALRESERLYRTVLEQASENICLVDVESGCVVEANPTFRETLGYTEQELHNLTLFDIVAHDRASVEKNVARTLRRGRYFAGQRKYQRKDGSLLEVEASMSRILRDGKDTLCIVAHDVSERARAQRLLEERVATLARVASSLTLDAPVEETLRTLAQSMLSASTATTYLVLLVDEESGGIRLVGSHGVPEEYDEGLQAVLRSGVHSPVHEAVETRRPVVFRDAHRILQGDSRYGPIHPFVDDIPEDTIHILPLVVRGRAIGAVAFGYLPGREPTEDEGAFLAAIADQIAVAIDNVRLFARARGAAALEERQRLARELHDSVSQALYGIALVATSAHNALEDGNPEGAVEPLEYVLSLSRGGMAEMRALIFELRPESLEKEGLVAALEKQAAAIKARHQIEVETNLGAEPDLSPGTREALYRVAREALHNTVKHARAGTARITLRTDEQGITLEISDDGKGFDPEGEYPGHLGLYSMRERASGLGGTLGIESAPGAGTRVRMWMPL